MEIGALIKVLLEGGFGIAAFLVVLWLLIHEIPENRKAKKESEDAFLAALDRAIKSFHDDLEKERIIAQTERDKDRECRHQMKDAFVALNIDIVERIRCREVEFTRPKLNPSPKNAPPN